MPACGVRPEAIAKAIASGSATRPTVMPAVTSCKNLFRLYSRRHRTDFGNQRSPQAEERTADMNSIMTGTRFPNGDQRDTKVQRTIHFGAWLAVKSFVSRRVWDSTIKGKTRSRALKPLGLFAIFVELIPEPRVRYFD